MERNNGRHVKRLKKRKSKVDDATKIYSDKSPDFDLVLSSAIRETKRYMNESEKKGRKTTNQAKKFNSLNGKKQKIIIFKNKKKIIIVLALIIIITGVIFAIQANKWKKIVQAMSLQKNSVILDSEGNEVAKVGEQKKKIVKKGDEIPQCIKNAYVAIEDERFYKHGGVDLRRTVSAIASYIIHLGKSYYGGSTITQQLVKNITGDNQGNIERKIKEWFRSTLVETFMSKDEVLELYLNIIYTGPNIYGVGAGAQYYFNKDVRDLSLAECAFLAGINNSPNSYNPFAGNNNELIRKRTNIVLDKMKDLNYIDEQQWSEAKQVVDSGLDFSQGKISSGDGVFSYHSDSVINECISDLEKKYNITDTFATNFIEMAGLKIHSTVQTKVQAEVETECRKSKYKITSDGETSQAAMVVIEPSTGNVVACVGGLGEKTNARSLNRATQSLRQTGSSIKPLSVLVPAISKNIINPTTICDDTQRDFGEGYAPRDFGKSLGKVTVRRALESSQNIPFVEIMQKITPNTAMDYLKRMGITSLTKQDCNLGLALGGQEKGITPLQMAAAYNTISNDGEYIEPTFYTQIEDNEKRVIIKVSQKRRRVFSKSIAFVIKQLLTQPVEGTYGTAVYCKINGVDVAAKTGTTDEDYDRWLCGFTPYYTATCWFGYDQNKTVMFNNRNPAGLIWANVMSRIHSGKTGKRFEMPSGMFDNVVSYRVCLETGKLARTNCENTYIEYYLKNNVAGYCGIHGGNENGNISNSTEKIKSTVNDIIHSITNDIDAIDPQEIEKKTQNIISPIIDTTTHDQEEKKQNTIKENVNNNTIQEKKQTNNNNSSSIITNNNEEENNESNQNNNNNQNNNFQNTPSITPLATSISTTNSMLTSTEQNN